MPPVDGTSLVVALEALSRRVGMEVGAVIARDSSDEAAAVSQRVVPAGLDFR